MMDIVRIHLLFSTFVHALHDLRDNIGPKKWTSGKWKGRESLIRKMLSYGKGCDPHTTREEILEFLDLTPGQIADHFKQE